MKKILILIIIISFVSCNNKKGASVDQLLENGSITELKDKKNELQGKSDSLQQVIGLMTERISELDPQAAKLVKSTVAQDSVYHHYIKLQASIETKQDVNVTPEYGGVMRLYVKEGQSVRKGQLLADISDGGLRDQLNQAKIQVDQAKAALQQAEIQRDLAKTTFERQKSLWDKNIGSEIQFLQARTNFETAQKQVYSAKQQVSAAQRGVSGANAQLAKTKLVAPFTGRVEDVITQSGQVVGPGVPVLRLINPNSLNAVANVPENYLSEIKKGTGAIISLPALNKQLHSQVTLISSSIDPGSRTFKVEVPVPNDGMVKPNLNAELMLNNYTAEKAIVVPESLIREDNKGEFIYVVNQVKNKQGVAKKKYIERGEASNGLVEITKGISSGDILITEASTKLEEGDKVEF